MTAVFVRTPEALETAGDAELVFLPASADVAAQVHALRDGKAGAAAGGPVVLVSVPVQGGEVEELLGEILRWVEAGLDGVHLRPSSLELDVPVIADQLLPELRARGLVGPADRGGSLRGRLGLGRPRNTFSGSGR
ncbi:hypothetical protein [Kribbella sp. NPDC004536]|uniref:hypothetical protein n=1 Tax=Kribbella sp. NPDC004536 TaxID=3364106 RepID=UPI00368F84FC